MTANMTAPLGKDRKMPVGDTAHTSNRQHAKMLLSGVASSSEWKQPTEHITAATHGVV